VTTVVFEHYGADQVGTFNYAGNDTVNVDPFIQVKYYKYTAGALAVVTGANNPTK